jgi:N-acyl-phosphatidylethanolamine-hydrolysing phospholipase D
VGHSTLLVQIDGINFLTDPMWSKTASPVPPIGPRRLVKLGLAIEDLPPIDFVVISHNHYDHMDVPTLKKLFTINPDTVFFVPMDNAKLLRKKGIKKVQQMDWGESIEFKNLVIHCLPSQHWSKRSLIDTNKSGWASWAMTSANKRFYFAGDSGYFDGFKKIGKALGPFDLAAMPIGAYMPQAMMQSSHMDPEQAVQATLDIQASKAVAIHFGTFDLADEPINEPPLRFKQAAQAKLGEENSWVLAIGETREF